MHVVWLGGTLILPVLGLEPLHMLGKFSDTELEPSICPREATLYGGVSALRRPQVTEVNE